MKFDIEGRMRNLRLPDGRTALIYSIFEAVMNGIQAIEELYPGECATKGRISIEVTKAKKSIGRITIKDNGIGLNDRHFESFNVCDTMTKADIGGRGVGRLVWLKAFRRVDVESTYHEGAQAHRLTFRFRPEDEDSRADLKRKKPVMAAHHSAGTSISLSQLTDSKAQITPVLLARNLCHHFFPIFIAGNMPQLSITIGSRAIDIIEYLSKRMQVVETEILEVNKVIGSVTITHVYVDPKIAKQLSNSILLTAQGRVVESVEVEKNSHCESWTIKKRTPALFVPNSWMKQWTKSGQASKSVRKIWSRSKTQHSQPQRGFFTPILPALERRKSGS